MGSRQGCRGIRSVLLGLAASIAFGSGVANAAEYIVKVKSTKSLKSAKAEILGDFKSASLRSEHAPGNLLLVDFAEKDRHSVARRLAELMRNENVEYVVENIAVHSFATPNDPKLSEQWAIAKVRAEAAWDRNVGSRDVVVAVIDTGVDYKHEDLAGNIWKNPKEIPANGIDDDNNGFIDDVYGWDFRDNDADPMDLTSDKNPGHGTHCAGITASVGNNSKGISGLAQVASIMSIRFLGADGSGDLMGGVKAIDYAIANGADLISASWGAAVARAGATPLIEAIERANAAGVIFVAAAANDGASNDTREVYPANAGTPNMISVAASQNDDTKPQWSNYGIEKVDIAAPGAAILSTLPGNKYGNLSGTSMATPLVSGLVALVLSEHKSDRKLTGLEVRSLLQSTGAKVTIETACMCRIDAAAALDAVANDTLVVVPNAVTVAPNGTQQFSAIGGNGPYQFTSSNPAAATITADGQLTGTAIGETTVSVTDANGAAAQSLQIRIADKRQPENGGDCPLGDPVMCQLMCLFDPTLPWCK